MSEPIDRIDHVLINVGKRLDEAAETYRRLGFVLTPRGHHSIGSSNHLAIFAEDYLELLGYEPQNAHLDSGQWGVTEGFSGLIFKTADAAELARSLHARSIATATEAPQPLSRPVDLPDGTRRDARFSTLHLDPGLTPEGRLFFCQHQTPDLVWRPDWQDHPNGVTGIAGLVVAAEDPARSIALIERLYPDHRTGAVEGGLRLSLSGAPLDYIRPDAARARFGAALPSVTSGTDRRVALILRTRSIAAAEAALRAGGVEFAPTAEGMVVPASTAFGVALVFAA